MVQSRSRWGRATGVERHRSPAVSEVDHHEAVTAQVAGVRLDDDVAGGHGYGRVDCVSAVLQNLEADAAGNRVGRRRHTVAGDQGAASGRVEASFPTEVR